MSNLAAQKILLIGANGQVGNALQNTLAGTCELVTTTRTGEDADLALDLGDLGNIKKIISAINPTIIINAAAYTQVDRAEEEPDLAFSINAKAPGIIAEACKQRGALLVHYSTDYVFNGRATLPYKETDSTNPINVYGKTKLNGEKAIQAVNCRHLIFRACWVYDTVSRNFVNAILERARTIEQLKVVSDQLGTPTSANLIAEVTRQVLEQSLACGKTHSEGDRVYNLSPNGYCSWHEFACEIVKIGREKEELVVKDILAVTSKEHASKAKRPAWSVLDNTKLAETFELSLKSWQRYFINDNCQ